MVNYPYEYLFRKDSVHKVYSIYSQNHDIEISNNELLVDEFEITESVCSDNSFRFGKVEAGKIVFTTSNKSPNLVKGKHIIVDVVPDGGDVFKIGYYIIDTVEPVNNRQYRRVTAYDYLYSVLNNEFIGWYKSLWSAQVTELSIEQFRNAFFQHIGLQQDLGDYAGLYNDNMVFYQDKDLSSLSGAEIIYSICELNAVCGRMGRDGKFKYIMWTDNPEYAYTIEKEYTISYEYEDWETDVVEYVKILNSEGEIKAEAGANPNGNVYVIEDNFISRTLPDNSADMTIAAEYIYLTINDISYTPITDSDFKGNPCIEAGDFIHLPLEDKDIYTYVLERVLRGTQSLHDSYIANGTKEYQDNVNTTSAKISELKKETEKVKKTANSKSKTSTGSTAPTSGNDGDLFVTVNGNLECDSITAGSGMTIDTQSGDNNSGYNVTAHCTDDTASESLHFKFENLNSGQTYTLSCKIKIENMNGDWGSHNFCLCVRTQDDLAGASIPVTPGGTVTELSNGVAVTLYYDEQEHSYQITFTASASTYYVIVDISFLHNTWYGTTCPTTVTNLKMSEGSAPSEGNPEGIKVYTNDQWKNLDYVKKVKQVQTSSGGTKIATAKNSDGTDTDIYAPTIPVEDVKVDGTSVVSSKIANINTMTGATASAAGSKGLVPAPAAGDNEKFLRGDGTFQTVDASGAVELTQAEYNQLTPEQKADPNKVYYIKDAGGGGGGGGASALADLTDVDIDSSLADGDVLVYNATSGKWENGEGGGSGSSYKKDTLFESTTDVSTYALSHPYTDYDAIVVTLKYSGSTAGTYYITGYFNTDQLVTDGSRYGIASDDWYVYFEVASSTSFTKYNSRYSFVCKIEGLKFGGSGGSSGGGTDVEANPQDTPTDTLETIKIGDTVYDIAGSGGSGSSYSETVLYEGTATAASYTLSENISDFDAVFISAIYDNNGRNMKASVIYPTSVLLDAIANNDTDFTIVNDVYYTNFKFTDESTIVRVAESFFFINEVIGINYNGGKFGNTKEIVRKTNVAISDNLVITLDLTKKYKDPYVFAVNVLPKTNWGGLVVVNEDYGLTYDSTNDTLSFKVYTNSPQNYDIDWIVFDLSDGGSASEDYSTTEKRVGTWIDGKPLYQTTLSLTSSSGNADQQVSLSDYGISNIETVCKIEGTALATLGYVALNYYASSNDCFNIYMTSNNTVMVLAHYGSWTLSIPVYVTLQYTKTTD